MSLSSSAEEDCDSESLVAVLHWWSGLGVDLVTLHAYLKEAFTAAELLAAKQLLMDMRRGVLAREENVQVDEEEAEEPRMDVEAVIGQYLLLAGSARARKRLTRLRATAGVLGRVSVATMGLPQLLKKTARGYREKGSTFVCHYCHRTCNSRNSLNAHIR